MSFNEFSFEDGGKCHLPYCVSVEEVCESQKKGDNNNKFLKIGDRVMWRGSWGTQEGREVKVTGISVDCIDKHGTEVAEVPWLSVGKANREIIVDLDNGHWAYAFQISPVTSFIEYVGRDDMRVE